MAYYDLNMNSKRITSTQDPTSAQDVVTKNYLDTYYMRQVKVERFTTSGTFTPPAGTTYAIAHIRGGGGSASTTIGTPAFSQGGNSSVAFASPVGTVTAGGGASFQVYIEGVGGTAGTANSGQGGFVYGGNGFGSVTPVVRGADGALITAGSAVTAGVGIAVQVGDGGLGSRAGGSGYVWIEYY